ncbi:Uncharacterized protein Rs2_16166 [Raphanus sativus]|nr:Uncharacterized protein Rs2_16166 [Raphanus sativus]
MKIYDAFVGAVEDLELDPVRLVEINQVLESIHQAFHHQKLDKDYSESLRCLVQLRNLPFPFSLSYFVIIDKVKSWWRWILWSSNRRSIRLPPSSPLRYLWKKGSKDKGLQCKFRFIHCSELEEAELSLCETSSLHYEESSFGKN